MSRREQKVLRNFLLAAAILFAWWFFSGARPLTLSQAVRWKALELGLKEPPEIIAVKNGKNHQRSVVFTADGMAVLGRVEPAAAGVVARVYDVEELEEVTVLWEQDHASLFGGIPPLCVITRHRGAVEAEVRLHLKDEVSVGHYTTLHEFQWDEVYTFTAEMKQGAAFLEPEGKYPEEYDENAEGYVLYLAEAQVLNDLRHAIDGYQQDHFEGTIALTIRDRDGNTLAECEDTL